MDMGQPLATQELARGRRTRGLPGTGHRPVVPHQHPPTHTGTATSPPLCRAPPAPSEQGQGQKQCQQPHSEVISIRFPRAKVEAGAFLLRRVLQRGRLEQEMGPVPIYTLTAPKPEPSFPSAVALYTQSHERHLTKSPILPYLHKSGAASTAQGITQGLAVQQRHLQGAQDTAFLQGSITYKPRAKKAPRATPAHMSVQPPPQAITPPGSSTVKEPHVLKQHHCAATILQVSVLALERCSRESQPFSCRFRWCPQRIWEGLLQTVYSA